MNNVQKVCHFKNTPSSQTFRIYLLQSIFIQLPLQNVINNVHNRIYYFVVKSISPLRKELRLDGCMGVEMRRLGSLFEALCNLGGGGGGNLA
jgi:hypothetical protein